MAKDRNSREVLIGSEADLKDKIHTIRGVQIMFDYDLAAIYGYETKKFNQQVKNNIAKFPNDFRFQLTQEEVDELSRSKILTSMQTTGTKGGRAYRPYVFTEQGIYMLMTVLKGELAIKQSIALVRLFKSMKDYLADNQSLIGTKKYLALVEKVDEHSREIKEIEEKMVTRTDFTYLMKLFDEGKRTEEILILDGEPFKADLAYQRIYKKAKKSIIIVDDYIGPKTLFHLAKADKNIRKTIISDNKGIGLRLHEYKDFIAEYPGCEVQFIKTNKRAHDRYIVLDYGTKELKVYHCGASSKDAGRRITSISEVKEPQGYKEAIKEMLNNPELKLK